jgi:hypothetical protein
MTSLIDCCIENSGLSTIHINSSHSLVRRLDSRVSKGGRPVKNPDGTLTYGRSIQAFEQSDRGMDGERSSQIRGPAKGVMSGTAVDHWKGGCRQDLLALRSCGSKEGCDRSAEGSGPSMAVGEFIDAMEHGHEFLVYLPGRPESIKSPIT